MEIQYLFFIIFSAFFHAYYNFLMRISLGSRYFLAGMFMTAAAISIIITTAAGQFRDIPYHYVPYVYCASFFYVLYQVFVSKSYERGNISALYPLTVLSPVFIPLWAFFLLSEKISTLSACGIVMTVIGAVIVKADALTLTELRKMFQFSADYRGARFALGASLAYSFGAVFDKFRIAYFPVAAYLSILLFFMSLNMTVYLLFGEKQAFRSYVMKNRNMVVLGGVVVYISFLFFRIALKEVDVSVVVPIRLISIVFAILMGTLLLKEPFGTGKLTGSLVIIGGIMLINMGA